MVFDSGNEGVRRYVRQALEAHDFLAGEDDLSPRNPRVNSVLSAFVRATMLPRRPEEIAEILAHPGLRCAIPPLRALLGRAESEMERFSAAAMTGRNPHAPAAYASFPDFIYRENYQTLVRLELAALGWDKEVPRFSEHESIAFVGAGPLPISAIMLHLQTGLPVTCIDSCACAARHGEGLIRHLSDTGRDLEGIALQVDYVRADGDAHDYADHPVIFIASLVEGKDSVIRQIKATARKDAIVVVRSAEGLGAVLYAPYVHNESASGAGPMTLSSRTAFSHAAINTSLVYRLGAVQVESSKTRPQGWFGPAQQR